MSLTKNLVVAAGFTLMAFFLVASHGSSSSYGGAALCDERTGVMCTSDAMCVTLCLQKKGGRVGGYCSLEHVVGDPSCVCTTRCEAPLEKPAMAAAAARRAVGMAN